MRESKAERLLREAVWIDTPHSRAAVRNLQRYGLTPRQFENMGHAQNWYCLGCDTRFSNAGGDIRVDHCHATGIVRGLLCHSCNITLGWARDKSRTLRRLANYLDSVPREPANG